MVSCVAQSIIRSNPHIHAALDPQVLREMNRCVFMSDLDDRCNWKLFGFRSAEEMRRQFSANREEIRHKITVPLLLIQPMDDPLHKVEPSLPTLPLSR